MLEFVPALKVRKKTILLFLGENLRKTRKNLGENRQIASGKPARSIKFASSDELLRKPQGNFSFYWKKNWNLVPSQTSCFSEFFGVLCVWLIDFARVIFCGVSGQSLLGFVRKTCSTVSIFTLFNVHPSCSCSGKMLGNHSSMFKWWWKRRKRNKFASIVFWTSS